tara:strand:- start:763 stop:1044 length:282 start_codon:yes stop_codon:yes gene_type:complete
VIKKADIVRFKGTQSSQVGIVDKVFVLRKKEYAVVRWIKPLVISNKRAYIQSAMLETLRTAEEAAQRGRKKRVAALDESSETHDVKIIREEEE